MQAMANTTTSIAERSGRPHRSSANGSSGERERGDDQRGVVLAHRGHSNFMMRSPSRPRGRNSSTSAISRYIEASPQDGLK